MKTLSTATGIAVALSVSALASAEDWSYHGDTGPDHWGSLSEEFGVCSAGTQQSPIDLTGAISASGAAPSLMLNSISGVQVSRNAHGVTYSADSVDAGLTLNGVDFTLLQFHFHARSEHHIDGQDFPMEVHFVTASEDGALAVVGVMFEEGEAHPDLETLWAAIPGEGESGAGPAMLSLERFIPADEPVFRYEGSLTTPPCSEIVSWTVFPTPIEASAEQIRAFTDLVEDNARPVLPAHRRYVLLSD
ncbi:carbonic anhydrase family protein [Maricaulis sp.]|uniref:carbonic anhydrase n=1 Tax=Maricaulis sp. TaxID=1486257 RepID=UPI0025B92B42|nr:carbonic anhydrase family protein [Maricaulis sp.]